MEERNLVRWTCCQSGPCRKEKRSRQSYTRILENWCDSGEFLHDKKYQQTQGVDKDHRVPDAANSDRECRWRR